MDPTLQRRVAIAAATLVVICGAAMGVRALVEAQRPRGTDTEQLMQMLFDGERAAERRSTQGVTRFLARDYRDSLGNNKDRMRLLVRDAILRFQGMDVIVEEPRIDLDEGSASGTVAFQVRVVAGPETGGSPSQIVLRVVKEPVRYYWLFPGAEWRIQSADGYMSLE